MSCLRAKTHIAPRAPASPRTHARHSCCTVAAIASSFVCSSWSLLPSSACRGPSFGEGGYFKIRYSVCGVAKTGQTFGAHAQQCWLSTMYCTHELKHTRTGCKCSSIAHCCVQTATGVVFEPNSPLQKARRDLVPSPGEPGCFLYRGQAPDALGALSEEFGVNAKELFFNNTEALADPDQSLMGKLLRVCSSNLCESCATCQWCVLLHASPSQLISTLPLIVQLAVLLLVVCSKQGGRTLRARSTASTGSSAMAGAVASSASAANAAEEQLYVLLPLPVPWQLAWWHTLWRRRWPLLLHRCGFWCVSFIMCTQRLCALTSPPLLSTMTSLLPSTPDGLCRKDGHMLGRRLVGRLLSHNIHGDCRRMHSLRRTHTYAQDLRMTMVW